MKCGGGILTPTSRSAARAAAQLLPAGLKISASLPAGSIGAVSTGGRQGGAFRNSSLLPHPPNGRRCGDRRPQPAQSRGCSCPRPYRPGSPRHAPPGQPDAPPRSVSRPIGRCSAAVPPPPRHRSGLPARCGRQYRRRACSLCGSAAARAVSDATAAPWRFAWERRTRSGFRHPTELQ
jgi:hypothetical protein